MNAIFCKFSMPYTKQLVYNLIRHFKIKNLYYIGSKSGWLNEEKTIQLGCKVIYFDEADLFNALFKEVKWNDTEPLDEEIISSMARYEYEVEWMMERDLQNVSIIDYSHFEKEYVENIFELRSNNFHTMYNITALPMLEKRRKYLRYLRFWNDFLKKNKIDLFVGAFYPHFPYENVLYRLLKIKDISTVLTQHSPIPGRWIIYNNFEDQRKQLIKEYDKILSAQDTKFEFDAYTKDEINRILHNESPYYMDAQKEVVVWKQNDYFPTIQENDRYRNLKNKNENNNYRLSLKTRLLLLLDKIHYRVKHGNIKTYTKKLQKIYKNLSEKRPNLSDHYIYVALHFQPEATSCPTGGVFADQMLIIDILSYYLPEGWKLYVKDHPKQGHLHRSVNFYYDLKYNNRVTLIGPEFNSFSLLKNSQAAVTITGTVALEALLNKKPCLLFGYSPLIYAPGAFFIRTKKECQIAMDKIKHGAAPTEKEIYSFLQALQNCTVPATHDFVSKSMHNVSDETYTEIMTKEYISVIEKTMLGIEV